MNTIIERVEFQAVAPKRALPGMDDALRKLEALGTALNAINQRLGAVTTLSAFKRTTKGIEDEIKRLESLQSRRTNLSLKQITERLGLPTEDVRQYILRTQEKLTQDIVAADRKRRKLQGNANADARRELRKEEKAKAEELKKLKETFSGPQMGVRSAPAAAKVLSEYQKAAREEVRDFSRAQAATLQSLLGGGTVGPVGTVDLAALAAAAKAKAEPAGDTDPKKTSKKKKEPLTAKLPPDAQLTGTKLVQAEGKPDRLVKTYRDAAGRTYETTEEQNTKIRQVTNDKLAKRAKADLTQQLKAMTQDAHAQLAGVDSAKGIANFRTTFTAQARALLSGPDGKRYLEAQLEPLVDAFIGQTLPGLIQKQIVQNGKASQRLRAAGQKNIKAQEREAAKSESARQKRWREDVAAERLPRSMMKLIHESPSIEAMQAADARARDKAAEKAPKLDAHVVAYEKAQKAARKLAAEQERLARSTQLLTGDFVHNTLKVAAWTASVGLLYGTLGVLSQGFTRTIEIGAQTARLEQVFRGVGGSAQQLASDVLHLAAVNGRSTDEAMAAAVQWSRMGLTRRQVNEAVRSSLIAANVAEMTAAEATDHLQAIMRNYSLEVSQLGSVLGELNEISNTYNVTNNDLLTGISRTASAAKQAGLPLQELIGILGATIGATKQSGANIGNAVKSVIIALSNPELQEKLRTQYGFEVTTGGEEIKSMSQIIGDLYVRYQKLTQIEQQSMLFNVAGKTQANRLAAVLDNYVRAQVLAINAQMSLNSAEEENQKILSTLKAQLAGVTAEWERFVVVQSNRGPVQVLNETARALRGVLSLMNTGPGSVLTTGLIGLATAASARALLAGVTARSGAAGGGFLARSSGTVMREAGNLNAAAQGAMWNFIARRNPAAMASGVVNPAELGLLSRFVLKTNEQAESLLRVAKGATAAGPAMRGLAGATGLVLKAVSLATVALAEFAVPLVVIGGAVFVFNRALEGLGVTSDRATDRLSRLNTEAERARAAAGAMGQAVRFMSTAQTALTERGRSMPEAEVQKLLRGVAEVAFLDEQNEATKARQTDELEKQLKLLHQQRDVEGLKAVIAERIVATQAMRRQQLQAELRAQTEQQATLRQEIARLQRASGGFWSFLGAEGRDRNLAEKKAQLEETQGKKLRLLQDEEENINDELERRLAYNERHLTALERQKVTLEAIAGIYEQIRTLTPMDRAMVQSARLTAQVMAETQNIARLRNELDNRKPGQAERDAEVKRVQEQRAALELARAAEQAKFNQANDFVYNGKLTDSLRGGRGIWALQEIITGFTTAFGDTPASVRRQGKSLANLNDYDRQIRENRAAERMAAAGLSPQLTGQDNYQSLNKQISAATNRRRDLRVEQAGLDAGRGLREQATRFSLGQQRSGITTSAMDYGRDETERNLRQQAALQARINELMREQNRTAEQYGELTDAIQRKRELEIGQVQRYYGILREINQVAIQNNQELMKSFMSAGPGEMLRKLAVFRRSLKGGMSQGEFFGMSPGMREDYSRTPGGSEYNPEMQQLRREKAAAEQALKEQGKMKPDGTMDWGRVNDQFMRVTDLLAEALAGLDAKILKALPTDALTTAGQTLGSAAEKLDTVADRLLAATAVPQAFMRAIKNTLKNPQSGGVQAGTTG